MNFDLNYLDSIELDGIDTTDYPDFCDAYIVYAEYRGEVMTTEQLDELNDDSDFVYDCVISQLF